MKFRLEAKHWGISGHSALNENMNDDNGMNKRKKGNKEINRRRKIVPIKISWTNNSSQRTESIISTIWPELLVPKPLHCNKGLGMEEPIKMEINVLLSIIDKENQHENEHKNSC